MNILRLFTEKHKSIKENRLIDSLAIKLSDENIEIENNKYAEIVYKTILEAKKSGFFKKEFLPLLLKRIQSTCKVGYGYLEPFDKTDCLTLSEKRALNLNTRAKYSRELINGLTEEGLLEIRKNKNFIKNMVLGNFHKISRKYELLQLRSLGIKKVVILDCCDERDCSAVKQLKKHWNIDEVPELPLPQCTSEYCRCMYIADESEFL